MSIFGTIMSKIFHHGEAAAAPVPGAAPSASPQASAGVSSGGSPAPTSADRSTPPPPMPDNPTAIGRASAPGQTVDVGQVLDGLAAKNSQKLDWKHSIVDMMKLLDLDSSLGARQTLAKELNYSGDMQDSAAMNIWLHKEVMQKLAQNGGKVPADLKV